MYIDQYKQMMNISGVNSMEENLAPYNTRQTRKVKKSATASHSQYFVPPDSPPPAAKVPPMKLSRTDWSHFDDDNDMIEGDQLDATPSFSGNLSYSMMKYSKPPERLLRNIPPSVWTQYKVNILRPNYPFKIYKQN